MLRFPPEVRCFTYLELDLGERLCHDLGHRDASGPSHDMGWAVTRLGLPGAVDGLYKGSDADEKDIDEMNRL